MPAELLNVLNRHLLQLDRVAGSDAIAVDFARALHATLRDFRGERTKEGILRELLYMHDLLLELRPRMANVMEDIQRVIHFVHLQPGLDLPATLAFLEGLIAQKAERRATAARHAATLFTAPRCLLLHSYSGTLATVLENLRSAPQLPCIIVAEQAAVRTRPLLESLERARLKYRVVSEFAISHIVEEVSLALFGALTLNSDGQVVMAPGSANLIARLRDNAVECYVILTTNKWSYWTDETTTAFCEVRHKQQGGVRYQKQVFSHDAVALDRFSGLITEGGVLTPAAARELYTQRRSQFLTAEAEIAALQAA